MPSEPDSYCQWSVKSDGRPWDYKEFTLIGHGVINRIDWTDEEDLCVTEDGELVADCHDEYLRCGWCGYTTLWLGPNEHPGWERAVPVERHGNVVPEVFAFDTCSGGCRAASMSERRVLAFAGRDEDCPERERFENFRTARRIAWGAQGEAAHAVAIREHQLATMRPWPAPNAASEVAEPEDKVCSDLLARVKPMADEWREHSRTTNEALLAFLRVKIRDA